MNVLTALHKQHTDLLRRVGRCLSFGCSTQQTLHAAALTSRLTLAWPEAYLSAEGYSHNPKHNGPPHSAELIGQEAVAAVGQFSSHALLKDVLRGLGDFTVSKQEVRVDVLPGVKIPTPSNSGLISVSRLGRSTVERLYDPSTPNIPSSSSASKNLINVHSAILSASQKPVAIVSQVLRVEGTKGSGDLYSFAASKPAALGAFLRELEERSLRSKKELTALEQAVRDLETETWDREDAVEDMGSAKS
ncbi:uncharacterized protein DNG_07069 [Cephalotrichum gorgonifer]|uniref:Uncharacterized protein n=1 Tax=Cephalotrichum gorgonifer TaxID=2041049 RepID=A0AAE8N2N1_9PEZI|nr:uncharacterized protein DNG_07069 [Cephalotrichum gorgonifer]